MVKRAELKRGGVARDSDAELTDGKPCDMGVRELFKPMKRAKSSISACVVCSSLFDRVELASSKKEAPATRDEGYIKRLKCCSRSYRTRRGVILKDHLLLQ